MVRNPTTTLMAILTIVCLAAAACKPQAPVDSGIRYVAPNEGLNMREEPSVTGKKMLTIPKGAQVQKLEEKPESFKIDNIEGKWTKISWQGKMGWVFGGYLSDYKPSSESENRGNTEADSVTDRFKSLEFGGMTGIKRPDSLEIRAYEDQCMSSEITNQEVSESGVSYRVRVKECHGGGRSCNENCETKYLDCSISAEKILGTTSGSTLTPDCS